MFRCCSFLILLSGEGCLAVIFHSLFKLKLIAILVIMDALVNPATSMVLCTALHLTAHCMRAILGVEIVAISSTASHIVVV